MQAGIENLQNASRYDHCSGGFCVGSGGWIRTIDLRVMSPTSCHCSTPRWLGARTYSPSGQPASTIGAAAFHDPVRDGTGWDHSAPRTPLVQGPVPRPVRYKNGGRPEYGASRHATSSPREALVHALPSPPRLTTPPARAAYPVISWGTYRAIPVSVLILRCISHLDAFSGSCFRT